MDSLLQFTQKAILQGAGVISTAEMEKQVDSIYTDFDQRRRTYDALETDQEDAAELRYYRRTSKTSVAINAL